MIHPHTRLVRIDRDVGDGVVATRPIPRGTITWVLDDLDRMFADSEVATLPACYEPLLDRWSFNDGRGHHVLCWDIARFMNHSCEPNCAGSELGFEIALRDVVPGEQLTNDYATFHLHPREQFDCRCGSTSCRGVVTHLDAAHAIEEVRRQLANTLSAVGDVDQPLWSLIRPGLLADAVRDVRSGATHRTS